MNDHLQHDPRTKQQIKDLLYKRLYDPVQEQFKKRINSIILKNCSLVASSHASFIYKGEFYTAEVSKPPIKMNRLTESLRPAMDEYLADLKELNDRELPYVLGYINQVLNASDSLEDYLQALPESMHETLKELILTCPCKKPHLSPEKIKLLQDKNQPNIALIKQRLVKNMLI